MDDTVNLSDSVNNAIFENNPQNDIVHEEINNESKEDHQKKSSTNVQPASISIVNTEFMCLLCESAKFDNIERFISSDQLRDHLVSIHSKFVAQSFLQPKTDSIHSWLVSIVDYSLFIPQLGQAEIQENNSTESRSRSQSQDKNLMNVTSNTLAQIFEAILKTADGQNVIRTLQKSLSPSNFERDANFDGETSQSSNNCDHRVNDIKLNNDFTFDPITINTFRELQSTSQGGEEAFPSNINTHAENTLTKSLSIPSSALRSSLRTSLGGRFPIESRAVRKAYCQICRLGTSASNKLRHIYIVHLNRKDLFKCTECDYMNSNSSWEVKRHSRDVHGFECEPISRESEHQVEIDMWKRRCFPQWRPKRQSIGQIEDAKNTIDFTPSTSKGEASMSDQNNTQRRLSNTLGFEEEDSPDRKTLNVPSIDSDESGDTEKSLTPSTSARNGGLKRHIDQSPLGFLPKKLNFDDSHFDDIFAARKEFHDVDSEHISGIKNEICSDEQQILNASNINFERARCMECAMMVKSEDRQAHVYRYHLKQSKLYECPLCDFGSHACSSDVRQHLRQVHEDHNDKQAPKTNHQQYSTEISEWNERCFPGWINRKIPGIVIENINMCKLCSVEIEKPTRHIAEIHLKIPLQQCPVCKYGTNHITRIRKHIASMHPNNKNSEPISNVVKFKKDFYEMHEQCFPGRPKRLVPVTIAEEYRRTKCNVCSQVVQRKFRLKHILESHFNKPAFKCRICGFSSNSDRLAVEDHVRAEHPPRRGRGRPRLSEALNTVTDELNPAKNIESLVDNDNEELLEMAKQCFKDHATINFSI